MVLKKEMFIIARHIEPHLEPHLELHVESHTEFLTKQSNNAKRFGVKNSELSEFRKTKVSLKFFAQMCLMPKFFALNAFDGSSMKEKYASE